MSKAQIGGDPDSQVGKPGKRKVWLRRLAATGLLGAILCAAHYWWNRREPQAPTAIFQGVTYGCERLETTSEGSGLVHWVRVDLTAPGIELYVTPLDPAAQKEGWQYRLRWPESVLESENLAVIINGCLFASDSGWCRMPGDFANGVETVVANHIVSHFDQYSYVLQFDDRLTPHLKPTRPPTAADLALAKWGIGSQGLWLRDGELWSAIDRHPNSQTAVAVDLDRKLLFLAVGEHISPRLILKTLADLGAKDGILLDGGGSSSMAIGPGAQGIRPGVLHGGWRPVATHFGVRAKPMQPGG